ncbi:CpaF family protein [bacterium]|nr:CpaF family protein [bacterium]
MAGLSRVVDRLVASGVPFRRETLFGEAIAIAQEEAPLDARRVAAEAVDVLVGLGPIEWLMSDPGVSDVLVNGPDEIWVERDGILTRSDVRFADADAVVAAVERVIAPLGLRLDRSSPAVDARLPDGSRLHAVVPPASVDGPVVAIRRFTPAVPDLDALLATGAVDDEGRSLLAAAVAERKNIVVAGATGAGKTTLLNVLSGVIPPEERVVTIEDAAELRLSGHVVRLEAHPPNAEGAGEVTMRSLVRHALRLRPDRIVVGEVRGAEAFDLIQAMATGHDGSLGTVHAGTAEEAVWRIETLALSAGSMRTEAVRRLLRSALDLVVLVERRGPRRRVASITAIGEDLEEQWSW